LFIDQNKTVLKVCENVHWEFAKAAVLLSFKISTFRSSGWIAQNP